ncbi:MAG TPA: O-antigen ligase family protein [Pirellulales bacterium]|jgi:hypothetical protein|nr:O-antigen ligase family protein [Pirellulales bacterium]
MHNSAFNLPATTNRATPLMAAAQPSTTVPLTRSNAVLSRLTFCGCFLFLTCFLMFGSGFKAFRPEVMGLLVHPFLIPIAIVSPFLLVSRLKWFPVRALTALTIFFILYSMSSLGGGRAGLSEIVKVATSGVAIIATALLIRSRADFVAGVIGLGLASATMALVGLRSSGNAYGGVAALDVGNKNAFSLFVLPAILLCGFVFFETPVKSKTLGFLLKAICVLSIGACVLAIFLSANRSGWLGCVIIGAMLLKEKKLYGFLLVGVLAAGVVYLMMSLHLTDVFERRWNQTFVVKNDSDEERGEIVKACLKIGLENPIAGVGANKLAAAIGAIVGAKYAGLNAIESHNVFAHVWGASGIFCFMSLGYVMWSLCYMPTPPRKNDLALAAEFTQAQRLLRMMVVLWAIRGAFTSAILYNPGFSMGLGLAIGLCALLAAKPKQASQGAGISVVPARYGVQH